MQLSPTERTIGEDFAAHGYRTALIGKAHFQQVKDSEEFPSLESMGKLQDLDFWRQFRGPYYGFEHVELARNHTNEFLVGQHYAIWMEQQGCSDWQQYFMPPTGTMDKSILHRWDIPEPYHYDTWIAQRTMAMLENYKEREEPFFLWASFPDPHPKYLVPEPWASMYDPHSLSVPKLQDGEHDRNPPHFGMTQRSDADWRPYRESGWALIGFHSHLHTEEKLRQDIAVYYGMISLMDKYIGQILDKLDELGLADNTLVVFTSDHGHFYGHHGLRAKGAFHYEDVIRVPLIVRWPGQTAAGSVNDAMQSLVDLAPTFLTAAGIPVPRKMSGVDQSEVWRGQQRQAREHILCENHHEPTTIHLKTYVDERYKITVYFNHDEYGEIFDLQEDPDEVRNLWHEPEYAELKQKLLFKYIWAELGKERTWMPRVSNA
jgi:uncharacterized sulfatase